MNKIGMFNHENEHLKIPRSQKYTDDDDDDDTLSVLVPQNVERSVAVHEQKMSYDAPLGAWVMAEMLLLGLRLGGRKPKIL